MKRFYVSFYKSGKVIVHGFDTKAEAEHFAFLVNGKIKEDW